jgi:hypothetical protein
MIKNLIIIIFIANSAYVFGQISKMSIINPGKGLDKIIIESSTLDSAIKVFGKNKIREQSVKGCGTFGDQNCGKENYLTYKQLGITFHSQPKMTDKIVRLIVIKKPCQYKTDKGIGIGSTKSDVIAKYGQPVSESTTGSEARLEYEGITYFIDKKNQEKVIEIFVRGPE